MGWSIDIKVDKPITEGIIQSCLDELPPVLREHFDNEGLGGYSKQSWGWSCAVDVNFPTEDGWYISGAYWSWKLGMPFAKALAALLEKYGYAVTLGEQLS
jgi:hypothetical protein